MNENQKLGTIMKELIRFSLPLILSGVLQQLYNWADAFIVGNVDGELSLSAIGVTSIPISFFITTITGFTLGPFSYTHLDRGYLRCAGPLEWLVLS